MQQFGNVEDRLSVTYLGWRTGCLSTDDLETGALYRIARRLSRADRYGIPAWNCGISRSGRRRKNQLRGIVAAAAWTGGSEDDFAIIEDNPTFQLFEPEFVLDVRCIAANDRQVSINNALSVDLTGQINAETVFGVRMINGTGG